MLRQKTFWALGFLLLAGPAQARETLERCGSFYTNMECAGQSVANDLVGSKIDCGVGGCTMTLLPENGMSITNTPLPHCDSGWTLLTYPGTATLICAHDLRLPQ